MGTVVAVDLGAESGRVMEVSLADGTMSVEERYRFANVPVRAGGTLYWDILRIWNDVQEGLSHRTKDAVSIGIDTWAVDFGLLDSHGQLIGNPVHYRDERVEGIFDWLKEHVDPREIYERTGIQFMPINTLYQLAAVVRGTPEMLAHATRLLTIPDLLNYWMTGRIANEFTNATTTQCYNSREGRWDAETLENICVPMRLFGEVVHPGERLGEYEGTPVVASATHDTGSAVAAVPARDDDFVYISSGTWSLVGVELPEPLITDATYEANYTNEGGVYGTYRFLKNVMGLWLIQQCKAQWDREGQVLTYGEIADAASSAEPFGGLVDPDDPEFLRPGNMPARIRQYCRDTGQAVPESIGAVARTVYESLAFKYRYVVERLRDLTGKRLGTIHVVGGGARNDFLNQLTADASGCETTAGPYEATALGNAMVQLIAAGEIQSFSEGRRTIRSSFPPVEYQPKDTDTWDLAYERFLQLLE